MSTYTRSKRNGTYTVLMLLSLSILFGFGALSVDVSLMRLAKSQAQDVADAASHAAVLELRQSGDLQRARDAATEVVAANTLVGGVPQLLNMDFGVWDERTRVFSASNMPNAVRVQVGRTGSDAVGLLLGPIFGWDSVDVRASATAATKSLQVALVMDITGSWAQKNFVKARDAALAFYDVLEANHGDDDEIGMVVFMNRFGWEYTPFTSLNAAASNHALVRDKWAQLNVGSYAGDYQSAWTSGAFLTSKHVACKVYGTNNSGGSPWSGWCTSGSSCYQKAYRDNFSVVGHVGGCFPNMPRYYSDEAGTDHTTGMAMANTMFSATNDPTIYKAMVVLTDGQPNGYGSSTTSLRQTANYTESRFRQYKRSGSHTTAQIEADTPVMARQMYQNLGVNTWFVSFVESRPFMAQSAMGDGWYTVTNTASDIIPIFEEIARALPIAVVE